MNHLTESHCEPPFWKDPTILFEHFSLTYRPTCPHSPFNFVARLALLSLFLGCIGSLFAGLSFIAVAILFGSLTALAILLFTDVTKGKKRKGGEGEDDEDDEDEKQAKGGKRGAGGYEEIPYVAMVDPSGYMAPIKEHFVNGSGSKGSIQPVESPMGREEVDAAPYSGPSLPEHTPPTSRNPFMNILLDDIKYHPHRPPAAPGSDPSVKQVWDDYFRIQWHSDPTDVFGKKQNQRQFITQPSTTVPNDQGSFANWLYKIPGKTCKEGGRAACLAGTDGGVLPWLNMDS